MPEKRIKPESFVTPAGTFVYPRLGEPDTKFKAEGEYSVKVRLSMEAAQPLIDKLAPLHGKAVEAGREAFDKLPVATRKKLKNLTVNDLFAIVYDEQEYETGEVTFNFKMAASGTSKKTGKEWSRNPGVFDAKRNKLDGSKVWGGSVGKVSFTTTPYFIPGIGAAGLTLRLEAVQVLDLVSGGERSGAAYGFEEEEGYAAAPETEETPFDTEAGNDGDF